MAQLSDELQYYPSIVWGLDPLFQVYIKMYISDILAMEFYPNFQESFCYQNHPICKVDILGTVVKKTETAKSSKYIVDDGTGVIQCCCWKEDLYQSKVKLSSQSSNNYLRERLHEIEKENEEALEGYQLGDLVHMKGKIKIFREQKEIHITYHDRVDNPMFQVERILELPRLYSLVYDKPWRPPKRALQELTGLQYGTDDGDRAGSHMIQQLKTILHEDTVESASRQCEYTVDDFLQLPNIQMLLCNEDNNVIDDNQSELMCQALSLLEEEGHVVNRRDEIMSYEVVKSGCQMEISILTILTTMTELPQYAEIGCHYLQIVDELHKSLLYSKVKRKAVLNCLQNLEGSSEVIRSTKNHFLPCFI